jgi:precorrin-2 dehydrogenase/sirohydrochlorin ferrochelatase
MLKLAGKKVVVVGGGRVAERKISGLINTNANITVVAPKISMEIQQLVENGKIVWLAKSFSIEDIEGAFMVFAATNEKDLNQMIKDAAEVCTLVTIADGPEESDFHVPAKVQRGRLTVAVSTGGASPTLARKIRSQLEQEFDERYEGYLNFLFAARQQILEEVEDPSLKSKLLNQIVNPEFLYSHDRLADFQALYKELIHN